jgi:hypothetical protein
MFEMQIMATIGKIGGLSLLIALLIKYVAPRLTIPVSDRVALGIVLLPPIVVALLLAVGSRQHSLNKSE